MQDKLGSDKILTGLVNATPHPKLCKSYCCCCWSQCCWVVEAWQPKCTLYLIKLQVHCNSSNVLTNELVTFGDKCHSFSFWQLKIQGSWKRSDQLLHMDENNPCTEMHVFLLFIFKVLLEFIFKYLLVINTNLIPFFFSLENLVKKWV